MTNKLVVIINSLKVPKIKKILLYEMKFLVPNYSCLQNPWLGGYRPQIPVVSVLNWICWTPPRKKFLGTPLLHIIINVTMISYCRPKTSEHCAMTNRRSSICNRLPTYTSSCPASLKLPTTVVVSVWMHKTVDSVPSDVLSSIHADTVTANFPTIQLLFENYSLVSDALQRGSSPVFRWN